MAGAITVWFHCNPARNPWPKNSIDSEYDRSAEEGDAAGKIGHFGAKELLRLDKKIIEMIDMERRVDDPLTQPRIEDDDPSGPVAIDLVDDGNERAVMENKEASLPGCDLRGIDLILRPKRVH
jgi:hypothetical protein